MTTSSTASAGSPTVELPRFSVPPFPGPFPTVAYPVPTAPSWQAGPYVPAAWRTSVSPIAMTPPASARFAPSASAFGSEGVPRLVPSADVATASRPGPDELTPLTASDRSQALPSIAAFLADEGSIEDVFATEQVSVAPLSPAEPVTETDTARAPWIDRFLASTPVVPMEAISGPPAVYRFVTPASQLENQLPADDLVADLVADLSSALGSEAATDLASEFADDFAVVLAHDLGVDERSSLAAELHHGQRADDVPSGLLTPMTPRTATDMPLESLVLLDAERLPQRLSYVPSVVQSAISPLGTALGSVPPMDAAAVAPWPLAEAADALDEISRALGEGDGLHGAVSARPFARPSSTAPLRAWADEDLTDIIPMRHASPTVPLPAVATPVASFDGSAMAADTRARAAAQALETLAHRVRAGELQLPGYDPRMGDAGALVLALAALLGVRLS